jgi:hypothetical protein
MQQCAGTNLRSAWARTRALSFHRGQPRSTHARSVTSHNKRTRRVFPRPLSRSRRQLRRRLYQMPSNADGIGPLCAGLRYTYGRGMIGEQGDASSWVLVSSSVARSVFLAVVSALRKANVIPSQLLNVQVPLFFKEIIDTLNIPLDAQSTVWVVCGSVILACVPCRLFSGLKLNSCRGR